MSEELKRYRRALEEVLSQLDWCANYFERMRKPGLARILRRKRAQIAARVRD
jgi:hypothetical protein